MNLNLDLGATDWKQLRAKRRSIVAFAALVLFAAGVWAAWSYVNHSTQPAIVRWRLDRYLAKHGKTGNFESDFPFPSRAEMQRNVDIEPQKKGVRTGKTFEVLQDEYCTLKLSVLRLEERLARLNPDLRQASNRMERAEKALAAARNASSTNVSLLESNVASLRARLSTLAAVQDRRGELVEKERALEPITSDLWDFQRRWLDNGVGSGAGGLAKARTEFVGQTEQMLQTAESYAAMYSLLGKELWVAGELLKSSNAQHRREGLQLAMSASRQALNYAVNGWVAARICEGYILPGLSVAEEADVRSPLHVDRLIAHCADTFRRNNEFGAAANVIEVGLAKALDAGDNRRADRARWEIAACYEQAGDAKRAISFLKQMQNPNERGIARRIAMLEREVSRN